MLVKSLFIAVLLSAPVALAVGPAAADPWKNESGNGRYEREYKYEWRDGNCKYEYKQGKHGYKEERKCKGGSQYTGGPPPWAPAYGYRANQRGPQTAYTPPFDIGLGNCNRELLGNLLGATAGGLAGSQIGDGRGQLAAISSSSWNADSPPTKPWGSSIMP